MKCTVHFSTPYTPLNIKDGHSNFRLLGVPEVAGSSPVTLPIMKGVAQLVRAPFISTNSVLYKKIKIFLHSSVGRATDC